jgi:hypothetical protein
MATTTNYGWTTPNDTDLVKDGAAAIRTLGSSVDTTTKALNPSTTLGDIEYRSATANTNTRLGIGSTGQVLTVAGGVPTWATSDDANAIQNALLTTTGDTIYASGASTPARLGIGSTGQVLTVSGGVPSWATPAGGASFVGASVYKTATQSIANSTDVALTFPNENFDTDSIHDNSTNNSRLTIPTGKGGKWLFTATIQFVSNTTGYRQLAIWKNGAATSAVATVMAPGSTSFYPGMSISFIANAVATDYFEVYATQTSGGSLNVYADATYINSTIFQCVYLGA